MATRMTQPTGIPEFEGRTTTTRYGYPTSDGKATFRQKHAIHTIVSHRRGVNHWEKAWGETALWLDAHIGTDLHADLHNLTADDASRIIGQLNQQPTPKEWRDEAEEQRRMEERNA